MPALSSLGDSLHVALPADSEVVHRTVPPLRMVSFPTGTEPANCGATVAEKRSTCSFPKVTLAADKRRTVLEVAFTTLKLWEACRAAR